MTSLPSLLLRFDPLLDVATILREAFGGLPVVRSFELEHRGQDYFVNLTVAVGADQRAILGTLRDIRRIRPDLAVEVFTEEIAC